MHVPTTPGAGLPVVLLLHGYSANAQTQANYFDLDSAVDRRRFILVKPNGSADTDGALYWASGFRFLPARPDDVAYLTAVLQDVVTAFEADRGRVFVVGHSNGAFMANRLACQRSERIAALVSVAGAVPQGACQPAQPVSVLTVHGTADPLVRYQGDALGVGPIGPYGSADATLSVWANADGCSAERAARKPLRLTCRGTGTDTTVFTYLRCPPGVSVEHWRLDGADHEPDFALPAWPDALLDFLWAHPKAAAAVRNETP